MILLIITLYKRKYSHSVTLFEQDYLFLTQSAQKKRPNACALGLHNTRSCFHLTHYHHHHTTRASLLYILVTPVLVSEIPKYEFLIIFILLLHTQGAAYAPLRRC